MSSNQSDRIPTLVGDLAVKAPVACAATTNIALTGEQTIDGVTTNNSRVLLTGQTDATTNGIYVSDTGTWERDADCDGPRQLALGTLIYATGGTTNLGFWYCSTPGTLVADGSMALNFIQSSTVLAVTSAYVRTLLTAVSQADFLTKAGFSTFFQTLIAASTAAALRLLLLIPQALAAQTDTFFTTTGTAPNFVLTPTVALGSYTTGARYNVKFHANGAGTDQMNISGLGNKALKSYMIGGGKQAFVPISGLLTDVEYDGTDLVVLDPPPTAATAGTVSSRSSNTILGASDNGNTIIITSGTFTQTITAAATLGNGWSVNYRNNGTGVITLDPNASETIDGLTTITLYVGESINIACDGAAFYTRGRATGKVEVLRQVAANVASVDFSLTGLPETNFEIEVMDLLPVTNNTTLRVRFSQSGSFVTTASYIAERGGTVAGVRFDAGTSSVGQIDIWAGLQTLASNSVANFNMKLNLRNPQSAVLAKQVDFVGASNNISGYTCFTGSGTYAGTGFATAVDGIRFLMDSGNINSAVFVLYAIRG